MLDLIREDAGFTKDEFVAFIEDAGIDSRNLFYSMPTQCQGYAFLGHKPGVFPEAEYCLKKTIANLEYLLIESNKRKIMGRD